MARRLRREERVTIRVLAKRGQNHCEIARALPLVANHGRRRLQRRRHVRPAGITNIGKESKSLEQVDTGLISNWSEAREAYGSGESFWENHVIPVLNLIPRSALARETGLSERTIRALRNGNRSPSSNSRANLEQVPREFLEDPTPFPQL